MDFYYYYLNTVVAAVHSHYVCVCVHVWGWGGGVREIEGSCADVCVEGVYSCGWVCKGIG